MVLDDKNKEEAKAFFSTILDMGIDFKLQKNVREKYLGTKEIEKILNDLSEESVPVEDILNEFKENILPYCTNFSSKRFLGFSDSGNSIGAIGGSLLCDFLQQNLINQSVCAPSATFVEIAVIQWLRETVGYKKEGSSPKRVGELID